MSAEAKLIPIAPVAGWHECHSAEHFVQFYEEEAQLENGVVGYVARALQQGAAAVVIATEGHLAAFERHWINNGLDTADARAQGQLVTLDAADTLNKLLRDGWPDRQAFVEVVEPVIATAAAGGRQVYAFGEMVALLWQERRYDAAIQLESLWNELASRHTFALCCAYPLTADQHAPVDALRLVCNAHSKDCELQNKALLLDRELENRKVTDELRSLAAAIVESSDDAIISKTLSSVITSWNPGAERLFGYRTVEMIGQSITRLIPPELQHEEGEILAKLARGQRIHHYETQRVAKDGRRIDVSLTVSPIRGPGGEIVGASSVARDISDRKHAENVLRVQEHLLQAETSALAKLNELSTRLWRAKSLSEGLDEMLRALIELLGADKGHIQLLDADTGILTIEAQSGFDQPFLDFFREVSTGDDSACGRALRSGERMIIEDVETDAPYAPMREVARAAGYRCVIATPLVSAEGKPLGIASTHFARPHLPGEQQLRRLDLYLRQASDFIQRCSMEQALRMSAESMRQADQKKDEFLALLAHELRNPLAPIRYALATAKKAGGSADQIRQANEIIDRQVSHMSRLLDDLLDVSRITRGTLELKKSPTELTAVMATAIEAARPILDKKQHTLSVQLPGDPVRLSADSVRLAQIFSNLLINAGKYTDPGGCIDLVATQEADELVVRVKDNGIGIAGNMLPRLFTMFSQAEGASTRSEGGLGIGLALVHGLVELHAGSISAHSEGKGRGSEFVVRLPLPEIANPVRPIGSAPAIGAQRRARVLVVDDNRDSATTCGAFLESGGHEVRVAFSGPSALEIAEEFHPQVVLLDIGMPEMDGYQVAKRLRSSAWAEACRLIAVTGWGQERDKERAAEAGFDHHLTKPVDPLVLEPLVADVARADLAKAALRGHSP